jgi:two-component system, sporulation sensor kinase B
MYFDFIKPLVINYTIIIALTYTANMFVPFNNIVHQTLRERIYYALFASFAGILCLLFPIEILGETNFDFRMVLILVVTLYCGFLSGFITFTTISIARLLVGGEFALIGVLVNATAFLTALILRKSFLRDQGSFRMGTVVSLVYMASLTVIIYIYIPFLDLNFYVIYFSLFYITFMLFLFVIVRTVQMNRRASETIYLEKLRTVGNMAAAFAHEIRNPLTSVRGFIQYLNEGDNYKNLKDHAPFILEELDRTNKIITDYLSLAKPRSLKKETIEVTQLVDDMVKMLNPIASYKGVQLSFDKDSEKSIYINTDKQYIQQCIINLVKNAIEAVENDGVVSVKVQREKNNVVILIEDNGVGLSKDELKKIGLPFYTTKSKGTGLGTMVTNRLIEEMKGSILYKSEKNTGTIVQITLPTVTE